MNAVTSTIKENGIEWAVDRGLYSVKLKSLSLFPKSEALYEKKVGYPSRLDIFGVNVDEIRLFIRNLPDEQKAKLKELADRACEGKIQGFSSVELDYGNPVDWQLNPLTGRRCDEGVKWYKIPDFDKKRGDIKAIWEFSRFSHFVIFARCYMLTGDKKYYKAFRGQLSDWIKKNPYSYGPNFKCGQECSLRMVNALLAFSVFNHDGLITSEDEANLKCLIMRCYRKILSNFFYAYKCIKNNHTISELLGMIIGSWCCGEDGRLRKAYKLLDEVIDEQFFDDGGYRQYSFNYQRLALQDLECVIAASRQTGIELNARSKEKVLKSAVLLYQCQDESGDVPNYGSNDGALVFPVTSCGYRDFRPVIAGIMGLTKKRKIYKDGLYDEEYLWFGGKNQEGLKHLAVKRLSQQYPQAGLYTIRRGNSWVMAVLNKFHSRPAQMDQLHIDLWVDGTNVLCDTGTYSYASSIGKRLRSTLGHNTAVVENTGQMNTYGPFMIYGWTKRVNYSWRTDRFRGHMKSMNGYEHIREIRAVPAGYEIIDQVACNRLCKVYFHTPCDVRERGRCIEIINSGKALCTMEFNNDMEIKKSVRSLFYMKTDGIKEIVVTGRGNGPMITRIKVMGQEAR